MEESSHPPLRGWLSKRGAKVKSIKKRWCVLGDGKMRYFQDANEKKLKGELHLDEVETVQHLTDSCFGQEFPIVVLTPTRSWLFFAQSAEDQFKWVEELREATHRSLLVAPRFKNIAKEDTSIRQRRIVLLGISNVGKSTIMRQFKVAFCGAFSKKQLTDFLVPIRKNVVDTVLAVDEALTKLNQRVLPETRKLLDEIRKSGDAHPANMAKIVAIWRDKNMRDMFARRSMFHVDSGAPYFMERLEHIAGASFCPSEEDIMHVRQPSHGVTELMFVHMADKKLQRMSIVDVAGDKKERDKYWKVLTGTQKASCSFVYVVSLSSFNEIGEKSSNGRTWNAMDEALDVFKETLRSFPADSRPSIFVLLNKKDAFEEKLKNGALLTECPSFRDYNQDSRNVEEACSFVKRKFERSLYEVHRGGSVRFFNTIAVDKVSLLSVLTHIVTSQQFQALEQLVG